MDVFFFQAEDGIRDLVRSRGLGDVYKRQVVNIQGDEPFLVPAQIDELTAALARSSGGIATLAHDLTDDRDLDLSLIHI